LLALSGHRRMVDESMVRSMASNRIVGASELRVMGVMISKSP
jgi:hypothetical protein